MLAKYEKRNYKGDELTWVGVYKNLHNISHWHLEHEIIACQNGNARIMITDKLFIIHEGQCVICPGSSVHYVDADEDCILMVCLFDNRLTKNITNNYELKTPVYEDKYDTISKLAAIHNELISKLPYYTDKTNSMLTDLVINIFRGEELSENGTINHDSLIKYKELLNWIDKNFEFISFSDAAGFMNLSETYFSRYFKKISGMTFSQYLNTVKVEKAVNILSTERNIPMTTLMNKCGFNTIRNFNRTFKEITGYSPKQLPNGFSLNIRSLPTVQDPFDPTIDSSILL
ncbi:AraC family transcriptional regulator [Clostridium omnivorum]|uniref:AraC family transcriptional regulator n=1 Tax=Clostridium omnivorum TaxID=1604902 RepID=A0ABQ5N205_9CLOT|nr:AraC family transcriptional regulator [Clostridium sp. E14]GLC29232.1 AraC family transcriptional regulator [Clostridium sp. E14]